MRKFRIYSILFLFFVSNSSFASWIFVTDNVEGDDYYIDTDNIRESNDLMYFWMLSNYLKPISSGIMSVKTYVEVDCESLGFKSLQMSFYAMPMSEGNPVFTTSTTSSLSNENYSYAEPDTANYVMLAAACGFKDL